MLVARTESLETMGGMFGRTPQLGERLSPLQTGLGEFKNRKESLEELQASDTLYLKVLMDHLPLLLENLALSVRNEEAARFLYDGFGLPKPEIAELATPVYLDLKEKLNLAHGDVEVKVYESQASLREMVEQIEISVFTFYAARLAELEKKKEECEEAIKRLKDSESVGETQKANDIALADTLQANLKEAEKELEEAKLSKNGWLNFTAGLSDKIFVVENGIQIHNDVAAPDPEKAL
jgi:hypothetical protein